MRVFIFATVCAALAAGGDGVSGQAPVREGLREAGGAVVEGTGRVVQGAGEAARQTGQAAVGAAQEAGQAARNLAGATAQGIRGGIDRLTPAIPLQARAGANLQAADQGGEARWRFQRHNGEWWYYSPDNTWMYHRDGNWNDFAAESFTPPQHANQQLAQQGGEYSGQHSAGYRGDPSAQESQSHSRVLVDRCGREYICENGRPVYLNVHAEGASTAPQQLQPTPAEPASPAAAAPADTPESPREINNNPDTAVEGDATTSGTGDGDTLR